MAEPFPTQNSCSLKDTKQDEDHKNTDKKFLELVSSLPKEKWIGEHIYQYQGSWFPTVMLEGVINLHHQQFASLKPTDVILVSFPKSGTTWTIALLFTIMNRTRYDFGDHPLLTTNPHDCVTFLELYARHNPNSIPDGPILATHTPYTLLPSSIILSGCRIVYVFRDPKDVFVSLCHFNWKLRRNELPPLSLEEAFELFCRGVSPYGPFWDHVNGYRAASLEFPDRMLLLSYEDMKSEPLVHVKRLAEFSGQPFSLEEENEGVVHKILQLCSFENLRNLEVNKNGFRRGITTGTPNSAYFRKGKVGDSKNCLTTEMIEHIDQIMKQKLK